MIGRVRPATVGTFDMWAIYAHPRDYPDKFVARLWHQNGKALEPCPACFALADTLEELRAALLDVGRLPMARSPGDDPCIVETWL